MIEIFNTFFIIIGLCLTSFIGYIAATGVFGYLVTEGDTDYYSFVAWVAGGVLFTVTIVYCYFH